MPGKILTPEQTADALGVKVETLATWRCLKKHGLPFVKIGGKVRYREQDIDAWVASRVQRPIAS